MKVTATFGFVFLFCSTVAQAADLSVHSISVPANASSGQIEIRIAAGEDRVAGLQFDLNLQDLSPESIELGPQALTAGKSVYTRSAVGHLLRILVTGENQTMIDDGITVTLRVALPPPVSARLLPVQLLNAVATDGSGIPVPLTTSDGWILRGTAIGDVMTLPQLVGGGSEWRTTLFITNLSAAPEDYAVWFFNDAGQLGLVPIDARGSLPGVTGTLRPGETHQINTAASGSPAVRWAMLMPSTPGSRRLAGLAVLRQTLPESDPQKAPLSSEAVVDFSQEAATRYTLIYDNVDGFVTTAALTNPDGFAPLTILADVYDDAGSLLARDSITLLPFGHTSFVVGDKFPAAVGRRGMIRMTATPRTFTGFAVRFSPFRTFTTFRLVTSRDAE